MIPFKGSAEGRFFRGKVEPCGVDTQVVGEDGLRHLSARHMLTGWDSAGQEAHIYVENNGSFDDRDAPASFHTVPIFYTDSAHLAPYLRRNTFVGESAMEADGLHIRFFEAGTA